MNDSGSGQNLFGDRKNSRADLLFKWQEVGGPRVVKPSRQGFGSKLLTRGLTLYAGGKVSVEYNPNGFQFCFDSPLCRRK